MNSQTKMDPRIQKILLNCSSSFRNTILDKVTSILEVFDKKQTCYQIIQNQKHRQCIACIKALTSYPQRWLIITNTNQRSKLIYNSCSQITNPNDQGIFRVGSDIPIIKDKQTAKKQNILIGDIDRIVYLIQHQYLQVFILDGIIIQNVNNYIKCENIKKLQKLMLLLPKNINKTLFCQKQIDQETKINIQNL